LLIISIIAISFAAIFVKWSEAPPSILSMYRMYFACLLLLPIAFVKRRALVRFSRREWFYLFISGAFLALHFILCYVSLRLTTVASSTIILSLQPIVAVVGGFLIYKERTSISTLLTIGISLIGVVVIGWGDFGLGSKAVLVGDLLSFLSVIAIVSYLL